MHISRPLPLRPRIRTENEHRLTLQRIASGCLLCRLWGWTQVLKMNLRTGKRQRRPTRPKKWRSWFCLFLKSFSFFFPPLRCCYPTTTDGLVIRLWAGSFVKSAFQWLKTLVIIYPTSVGWKVSLVIADLVNFFLNCCQLNSHIWEWNDVQNVTG